MRRPLLRSALIRFGCAVVVWCLAGSFGVVGIATANAAKAKKQAAAPPPAGKKVNACGCYADAANNCFCGRKGKCDCPGECEPKGCEEKRAKAMEKEVAAETKRAAEADKKQKQKSAEAEKKQQQKEAQQKDEKPPAKE
jgi:hypothetical protein